jgi:hypothetical protein
MLGLINVVFLYKDLISLKSIYDLSPPFRETEGLNKIKTQEYKYPYQVHKVPVQSCFFYH